jgi:hypothetical protein
MSKTHETTLPPAYEQAANAEPRTPVFLDQIRATADAEYNNVNDDAVETERLRNFLLYCLAVDYRAPVTLIISGSDREHYLELAAIVGSMRTIHQSFHLTAADRKSLAPYFWKYLHSPCTTLGIPVESAAQIAMRYSKFLTMTRQYKGCVHGVMHNYGVVHLARKFLIDRSTLIPHLATSDSMRRKLMESLTEIAESYFTSIKGESSEIVVGSDPTNGFQEHVITKYTLTERGRRYRDNRDSNLDTVKRWIKPAARSVLQRIIGIAERCQDIFPKSSRERLSDDTCVGPIPTSRPDSEETSLWGRAPRTRDLLSTDIPDLFEHRQGAGRCDL